MTDERIFITNQRFWLIAAVQLLVFFFVFLPLEWTAVDAQGQRVLEPGLMQPRQRIKNTLGGVYSRNITLFFRNSPYFVESELIVDSGVTIQIETGVQIYFATGVGLKVYGTIVAIVSPFSILFPSPVCREMSSPTSKCCLTKNNSTTTTHCRNFG